jgi:hypothetical protein
MAFIMILEINYHYFPKQGGRNSVVGIVTRYGLDRAGIESPWGAIFSAPVQTGPGAHPAARTMGSASLSRGKAVGLWR